jgi:hypothetical protein
MALQFFGEHQKAVILHPLRIENAVKMVAFVLHDASVKPAASRAIGAPSSPRARYRMWRCRGTTPRKPGTDRQPSQARARSSPTGSTTGLISTVSSSSVSPARSVSRPGPTRKRTTRHGMCTCGAAMPVPPASSIVSRMSSTSRLTQGAVGSAIGSAGRRKTGCPMRAIFSNAIASLCGAGRLR